LQRHQFRMGQGLLIPFAAVAAPADRPAPFIQHHCRHGDFTRFPHPFGSPQQPPHPALMRRRLGAKARS